MVASESTDTEVLVILDPSASSPLDSSPTINQVSLNGNSYSDYAVIGGVVKVSSGDYIVVNAYGLHIFGTST